MRRVLLALVILCLAGPVGAADNGVRHGVILLYHHVSSETPASTSVTPAQFRQHLDYLADNDFRVIPLERMLDALYGGGTVPDNAVAITFDDAYESVYTEAWPKLARRDWPFTVFVADESVDKGYRQFMSWEQLREMARDGVAIGAHSVSHGHLARPRPGESAADWHARVEAEITDNVARLEEQLEVEVTSFAYPYGEYNDALQALVSERDLYGLAQQSGAVGPDTPSTRIPRFPMASGFADLERFATAVTTRPLPVVEAEAGPLVLAGGEQPDHLVLELAEGPYRATALACFSAGGQTLEVEREDVRRYRIALPAFHPGRNKINCTAPSSERGGGFFWYSRLWLAPRPDGSWPEE